MECIALRLACNDLAYNNDLPCNNGVESRNLLIYSDDISVNDNYEKNIWL